MLYFYSKIGLEVTFQTTLQNCTITIGQFCPRGLTGRSGSTRKKNFKKTNGILMDGKKWSHARVRPCELNAPGTKSRVARLAFSRPKMTNLAFLYGWPLNIWEFIG